MGEKPRTDKETLAYALAEYCFRDHPLGTDENVETLAVHIVASIDDGIVKIEADADQ